MSSSVTCWCGTNFEFMGQVGICPHCGEYAVLKWATSEEQNQMRREMDDFLSQLQTNEESQT